MLLKMPMSLRSALPALFAALLFGASTPLAKLLGADMPPFLLAGVLYLGSGLGLAVLLCIRYWMPSSTKNPPALWTIPAPEWPWLLAAIGFGGVLGPVLLLVGLRSTEAASASLLLNVEGVFTAWIAWVVFKENADRHIVWGMVAIVAGGVLLSWQPAQVSLSSGALFIMAACLCWALDNNLTRKVSANDGMLVACLKGLVAGTLNTSLGLLSGDMLPANGVLGAAVLLGFASYGLSLTLFVVSLRLLGSSRTGAYFSVAPLFGVILSMLLWPGELPPMFWPAAALMALGVWLHLHERHIHLHTHTPMEHTHHHRHDEHHQHVHDFVWDVNNPHAHPHRHRLLIHFHHHYPDIHHRHSHVED